MKKEDVISAGIMTIVSMLVLIGFTVAWYTGVFNIATLGGIHLKAAELNSIKVALTEDGPDISEMNEESRYADIGLQDMLNVPVDKLAPGQFGEVTFYLTPSDAGIEYCEIIPEVCIRQGESAWYPGEASGDTPEDGETPGDEMEDTELDLAALYEITQEHIVFFEDEEMEHKLDGSRIVEWTEADGEKTQAVTIYWQWYYEYPFSDVEKATLTEEEQQELIDDYDAEDTRIGNNVTAMKFHFTFSAQ